MNFLKANGGSKNIDNFIEVIRSRPALWDKSNNNYKKANKISYYDGIKNELNLDDISSNE